MAKLFDMLQARATATENIRALMAKYEDQEMPAEDKAQLTKMEAEFDALNTKITNEQKQLERERVAGEKPQPVAPSNDEAKAKRISAFNLALRTGDAGDMKAYAALQQDNPTQAGYLLAPEEFRSELIKEVDDLTFMRQKANVLPPLRNAQSLGYPVRTAAMSSFTWGTELQAPTNDTTLAFGKREFKPRPGVSGILVSKTLVRNVASVDSLVRGEIAAEVAKQLETAYMTGDGATMPLGLFVASNDGIPTSRDVSTGNTATEMKFDGLLAAMYSVKPQYQAGSEWIFSRAGVLQLAKLKNSDGQYIWQPSVVSGTPDMLFGKPVNMSEYAPGTFTTGLYVGLYGNLKNYWICDAMSLEIQVLNELYAATNQTYYISRIETDGAPVLSAAFARVKLG